MTAPNFKFKHPLMQRFLPISVTVTLAVCLVLIVVFELKTQKDVSEETRQQIQHQLSVRYDLLNISIHEKRRQIQFLYSTPPIKGIMRATENGIDPFDGTSYKLWISRLQTIFVGFLENNPQLAQIRYIGVANEGKELVRADRVDGNIRIITGNQLQKKSHKEYFKKATSLKPNELYVSDISLNQEHGKIEFPYWSTYRVAMPVYSESRQLFGIVIINIFAETVLQSLQQNMASGFTFYLLNSNSDFVIHPDKDYLFGSDLESAENWSTAFLNTSTNNLRKKNAKQQLLIEATQRSDEEVIYYQKRDLAISGIEDGRYLRLVVAAPKSHLDQISSYRRSAVLIIVSVILVVIIALISFYQNYINRKIDLSEARSEYEAIINGSTDAIVAMDSNGVISRWNRSAELIFGYPSQYIVGKSLFEIIKPAQDNNLTSDIIREVYDGDVKEAFQVKAINRSGSEIDISVTLSSIYSSDTGVLGVAAIIRDITSQIIIEEKIKNMNASLEKQVKERTKELEQARNQALESSKAKSEFVANVSHEIRTPMNGVLGMLKLLKKARLTSQQKGQLMMAETSALTLTSLINDILDVSKMEAGKLELSQSEFDLPRLISDVFSSMFISTQKTNLECILNINNIPYSNVIGDANRLRQILTNLIGNAIKFTESGEIELSAEGKIVEQNSVRIVCSVRDTGIGISTEKKDTLFEAFSQEDGSITKRFGGTGLGLTITRQLCHMMNGSIGVSSNIDQGSTFTFDVLLELGEQKGSLKQLIDLDGANTLIIDSNEAETKATTGLLTLWNGKTTVANSLDSAQQLLQATSLKAFDMIIISHSLSRDSKDTTMQCIKDYCKDKSCKLICIVPPTHSSNIDDQNLDNNVLKIQIPITPFNLCIATSQALNKPDYGSNKAGTSHTPELNQILQTHAGCHILVVDDNEINHEVTAGLLEDYPFSLSRALNGSEAISFLSKTNTVSAILMDCQMPIMDGYTASKQIRSGKAGFENINVPIIAMTANAMSGDRDQCLAAGMSDYISKPLQPDELEDKLAYWLSKSIEQSKTQPEKNSLPIWDREALLGRVRNREDRVGILVKLFIDSAEESLEKLKDSIDCMNFNAITSIAHSIKGTAANLGAIQLQNICENLEAAAKNSDQTEVAKWWDHIEPTQKALLSELTLYESQHQDSA